MKILFFSASFCSNCPAAKKAIKNLKLDTINFDADEHPEEFKTYGIRSIPSIVLLDNNGQEVKRLTSKVNQDTITEFLKGVDYDFAS